MTMKKKLTKKQPPSLSHFSLKYYILLVIVLFILIQLWMTSNATKPIVITSSSGGDLPHDPIAIINEQNIIPHDNHQKEMEQVELIIPLEEEAAEDDDFPRNSSLLSTLPVLKLPSVSIDQSELILSSMIERTADSWLLHLTTFFLSRAMIDPNEIRTNKVKSVRISSIPTWEKVNKKQRQLYYLANGRRALHRYECRIQVSGKESYSYTVPGTFLPNRQTTDSNANRRLDIMRCSLPKSRDAYLKYARSDEKLFLEILRNDEAIARISIPWKTRRTGYLLSSPTNASQFDAWKGYQKSANQKKPITGDSIYLCPADTKSLNDRSKILHILEFVQHHIMMKVSHMFISSPYSWSSASMDVMLSALSRYVRAGQVSVVSYAGDNIHNLPSTHGLWWSIIPLINFHLNSCLFLSKGTADYIGVWDLNELFIPRLPYSNIMEVIVSSNPPVGTQLKPANISNIASAVDWKGGPGWADGDGHPYCYLALFAAEIMQKTAETIPSSLNDFHGNPWSTSRYGPPPKGRPTEPSKSILPTKTIFQAGPYISGACQLDWEWTHCGQSSQSQNGKDQVCYVEVPSSDYIDHQFNKNPPKFPAVQDLDSVVFERDVKRIDMDTQGILYHLSDQTTQTTGDVSGNAYIHRFANGVESVLHSYFTKEELYSYYLPGELPPAPDDWLPYSTVFPPTLQESLPPKGSEDIKSGSNNGYLNFEEPFTRNDILENPPHQMLPTFAADFSDILLSSIIERKHHSWDLHLSSFMVTHTLVSDPPKGYGMRRLSPVNERKWRFIFHRFYRTKYRPSGARDNSYYNLKCRIRNGPGQEYYEVDGFFMPNALTPDGNANRRVDIFRCKIQNSKWCYQNLANTDHFLEAEIVRSNVTIFKFSVPWKTRRTGFLLDSPVAANSFDPWKGFDPKNPDSVKPGDIGGDQLYMAVPGIESPFTQKNFPMYAEFLQHHYLLGVQHMFWAVTYAWNGLNMANFLTAFKPFIDEKLLTVNSQAGDNIDLLYSFLGASVDRDNIKIMHVNMILYLTKGVVDYLAIWDIDEYFIPRLPYNSIMEVVRAAESPTPLKPYPADQNLMQLSQGFKGGRGWADNDAHPFCYLMIFSEVIYASRSDYDPDKPWVGERLQHLPEKSGLAFKKSIIPTRRIWQVGLHMHGACDLGPDFWPPNCNINDEFCYAKDDMESRGLRTTPNGQILPFSTYQHFDASVYDRDAKAINIQTEATIYHFQIHRPHLTASVEVLNNSLNEYVLRFYPAVKKELYRRNFDLLIRLPDASQHLEKQAAETTWLGLEQLHGSTIYSPDAGKIREQLPINPLVSEYYNMGCELPTFPRDYSELIFGSVIERDADSFALHLAVFLISREQLANKSKRIKNHSVRPDTVGVWSRAIKHAIDTADNYTEYGTRVDGHVYYCKLSNYEGSPSYMVKGVFIPNQLTPDANANRRLDILRCPIWNPQYAYQHLANSSEHLHVEIIRDTESLVKFKVPWKLRKTGYMLTTPPHASELDLWKGSPYSSKPSKMDELHMCVPGIESAISKSTIAIYSEFFEHHYLLGVDHIHAAVTYTWNGPNMKLFLGLFRKYIQSGRMSVTSTAGDIDGMYGLFGMNMERDNVKVFNVNMCLYLAKGVADYVAIWDVDEYFIPKPPHHTIMDVIRLAESPTPLQPFSPTADPFQVFPTWKGGRGWADLDGHPFCYLMMSSEALYRASTSSDKPTAESPWVGDRFTLGPEVKSSLKFKKPIIPTRKIFQAALHMVGGCKLDYPWNGCPPPPVTPQNSSDNFCYVEFPRQRYGLTINRTNNAILDFSFEQRFDGLILDKDAKKIEMETQGVIYHFQVHRGFHTSSSHQNSTNDYVKYWYPKVRNALLKNGYEIFVRLPSHIPFGQKPDERFQWPEISEVYKKDMTGVVHLHG